MSDADGHVWVPTVQMGFVEIDGKQMLCQCWISTLGGIEWRPVPSVDDKTRPLTECVAGSIEDDILDEP